jgi:hypothetical protein
MCLATRSARRETDVRETMSALGHKVDVKFARKGVRLGEEGLARRVSLPARTRCVGKADSIVSTVTGVVLETGQMIEGARKVGMSKETQWAPRSAAPRLASCSASSLPRNS